MARGDLIPPSLFWYMLFAVSSREAQYEGMKMTTFDIALSQSPIEVKGIRIGTGSAGIKTPGKKDLVIFEIAPGSSVAGVFTLNAFCAAPVQLAKRHIAATSPRYFLINTGNANAGTGQQGMQDAQRCCDVLAEKLGCDSQDILPFSTGVIGEPLPTDKIVAGMQSAIDTLSPQGWDEASYGIMTTDTKPKICSAQVAIDGQQITVTGISKGAGMIMPNMATMLAYIATDAAVDQTLLQQCLSKTVNESFNRVTVDGDTSTNDACMLVATGKSELPLISNTADLRYAALEEAIRQVAIYLAQAIVRDGEGATKFITVQVEQGRDQAECYQVALTVANSPLVKTAFFAGDPNWGRILAAVGRAGIEGLDVEQVSVYLDEVCIVEAGGRAESYSEELGQKVMDRDDITVRILLSRGVAQDQVWTCDFSYDYVKINAEYRT